MQDVKARTDNRVTNLKPFVVTDAGIGARVDEFPQREESKLDRMRPVSGGARDVPQQVVGRKGNLGPDVRQPPV